MEEKRNYTGSRALDFVNKIDEVESITKTCASDHTYLVVLAFGRTFKSGRRYKKCQTISEVKSILNHYLADQAGIRVAQVQDIKPGTHVKRSIGSDKVFTRGEYNRFEGKYELQDWDDFCHYIEVKRGTELFVDFTF